MKTLFAFLILVLSVLAIDGPPVIYNGTIAELVANEKPPKVATHILVGGILSTNDTTHLSFMFYPGLTLATNEQNVFAWGDGKLVRTLKVIR